MNRNMLVKAFIFVAGATIGSAVTWKVIKNKYEQITQEEIKDAAQQIQEAGLQESEHMAENIEKQLEQNMLSDDVEVKAT